MSFDELHAALDVALRANQPGSSVDHVLVVLPSFSVAESLLSHYAERIPALEHRYLVAQVLLARIENCHMVFVCCEAPRQEICEYYRSLVRPAVRGAMSERFEVLEVPDRSSRAVAAKLLDRPDLIDRLRASIAGRPALIDPWNVTSAEVDVARRVGAPINGTAPELRVLGFKSQGRRLFRQAGVPVPFGVEDVASVDEVERAIAHIGAARPATTAVIVKLDDSGAGDGNVVVDLRAPRLRERLRSLPEWYLADLEVGGGVVEERIIGARFTSPSAQIDVLPDGAVRVLATHEQVLGGVDDQVYLGCRLPAAGAYTAELAGHAERVGEALARRGALGRIGVDFAAAGDEAGRWRVYALEMNIRKGGTTHPYAVLRNLVPGHYDAARGEWTAADGSARCYVATDNLVDPAWVGMPPGEVIDIVRSAGLQFDPEAGTGVVLHMLSGLAIDGRFGLTAIDTTPDAAAALYQATATALTAARSGA